MYTTERADRSFVARVMNSSERIHTCASVVDAA